MRILMVHNFYQHPGGEDQVFEAEQRLLIDRGHTVIPLTRDYTQLQGMHNVVVAGASLWNHNVYREIRRIVRQEKIEIAHFHNTFPLVSPAAYYAVRAEGVPVVQTLHNYRLLCPGALFYREGRVCEDCLGRAIPWPGVRHACYRGSTAQTIALAGMLSTHRLLGTWTRAVDIYIALTDFARKKFVAGGVPGARIRVKPNFMSADPGAGTGAGGFALFAGRLTEDKGVRVLLDAWQKVHPGIRLKIVGDGPLLRPLSAEIGEKSNVELLGRRSREEVIQLMKAAAVLIVPSLWYEGFPMTIIEAYACGLPVIASDLGSLPSVVPNGGTGFLFKAGDSAALAACVNEVFDSSQILPSMRTRARAHFSEFYSAEPAYSQLMSIYQIATNRVSTPAAAGESPRG